MISLLLSIALAGDVELTIDSVGKPVTQNQRVMLQSTLQRTSDFYGAVLGIRAPDPLPMKVTVYSEKSAFEEIKKAKGAPPWSEGFFRIVAGRPEAFLWSGSAGGMRPIFLHEASHYLLSYGGFAPRWLNEGLAQVMETANVRGNALSVTPTDRHRRILAQLGRPSAEQIVGAGGSWNELPAEQVGPLYIAAWALTAVLLSTPDGQQTTAAILAAHRRSPNAATVKTAIEDTYPGGMAGLERAFDTWASRPPRSLMLHAPIQARPAASDALWLRCKDGRLVSRTVGCN